VKTTPTHSSAAVAVLLALCATLAASVAQAQAPSTATTTAPATTTPCDPKQDPAACAREAGAARQEAARGGLTQPGAAAGANASARCDALPAGQRADCEARMQGGGAGTTTNSGSVMGGGVIRETVTPIPAPAPAR